MVPFRYGMQKCTRWSSVGKSSQLVSRQLFQYKARNWSTMRCGRESILIDWEVTANATMTGTTEGSQASQPTNKSAKANRLAAPTTKLIHYRVENQSRISVRQSVKPRTPCSAQRAVVSRHWTPTISIRIPRNTEQTARRRPAGARWKKQFI